MSARIETFKTPSGKEIPVKVEQVGDEHIISIDGVEWVRTKNKMHATVLFEMIVDHITEYMSYA